MRTYADHVEVTFRPMPAWPHPRTPLSAQRSRSTFKASFRDTVLKLEDELRHLRAKAVIIGAGLSESDIRLDGWPRSDARMPAFSGVELSFDTPEHGRLVYATDTCEFWEHNVRSITLGLESLRAVDRYGITRRGEQYAGWKALGSGIVAGSGVATEADAWAILCPAAGYTVEAWNANGTTLSDLYRMAAKATHPDQGGDGEAFVRVQAAYEFLKARA